MTKLVLPILLLIAVCNTAGDSRNIPEDRPSDEEIALWFQKRIDSPIKSQRIGLWLYKNGAEILPLLIDIGESDANQFTASVARDIIKKSTSKKDAPQVVNNILEGDYSTQLKITALEIASDNALKGADYRKISLEYLHSSTNDSIKIKCMQVLETYGQEEDAHDVLGVMKESSDLQLRIAAGKTLCAIGGADIIDPWQQEIERLQAAEPERVRREEEEKERLSKQYDVTFGPMPEGPSWIDYIEKDLQSLKEKVAAQEAAHAQEENPKSSSQGGGEEGDEVRASSTGGQSDAGSESARPWRSFPIVLAGMIALAVLIALARKRKA